MTGYGDTHNKLFAFCNLERPYVSELRNSMAPPYLPHSKNSASPLQGPIE